MAPPMDVRAELASALKRLVRDANNWPLRERRRFRNLLLDSVSSDAMPLTELMLRVHDDGQLTAFPDRSASRAAWDTATARLAGDLQTQGFLEPTVARYIAESWAQALGPDVVPSPRAASPRPVVALRPPPRSSAPTPMRSSSPNPASAGSTAQSVQAYRRSNVVFLLAAVVFTVLTILAFRQTNQRGAPTAVAAPVANTMPVPDEQQSASKAAPPTVRAEQPPPPSAAGIRTSIDSGVPVAITARTPVPVAPAPKRTTDDVMLRTGRVFEGKVLSVRQQSILVKDAVSGLEFEIAKSDIDRVVTHDGRTLRFGDDNAPLIGDDDVQAAVSHAGRYKVHWSERWGTTRKECGDMARQFAPGTEILVQHLRGAPMMRLAFENGQAFNASVHGDGLFESNSDVAPARGPAGAFVSTRLSGRFTRNGGVDGIARLSAVQADGSLICDVALTMRGARER